MSTQRIEDFGEVIQGARKDAHAKWLDNMKEGAESSSRLSQPFSKRWPEPNYATMRIPDAAKSWVRAARDMVGAKPAKHLARSWEGRLYILQRLALDLSTYPWEMDGLDDDRVGEIVNDSINKMVLEQEENGNPNGGVAIKRIIERTQMLERAYAKWGVGKSLKALGFYDKESNSQEPFKALIRESKQHIARQYKGETLDDLLEKMDSDVLIQSLKNTANGSEEKKPPSPRVPKVNLEIISYNSQPERGYHIAVKHHGKWQILESFADRDSARSAYRDPNRQVELIAHYLMWRKASEERSDNNVERKGFDWREGRSISPDEFMQTFGFRGVQFGNYVENNRRQQDLNETYDALLDMAWALDVSPQSLSLNGTLGLAFGARGRGGIRAPNAHYELNEKVINLTKRKGAGSLAHEWFHALDHYLMDQLKKDLSVAAPSNFLTEQMTVNKHYSQAQLNTIEGDGTWGRAFTQGSGQVLAIKKLLEERSNRLDEKRREPYWSLVEEIGARSFEAAIRHQLHEQGWQNDYLANILPEQSWGDTPTALLRSALDSPIENEAPPSSYPYPLNNEQSSNAQHMIDFFKAVRTVNPIFKEGFDQAFLEVEEISNQYEEKEPEPIRAMPVEQMGLF